MKRKQDKNEVQDTLASLRREVTRELRTRLGRWASIPRDYSPDLLDLASESELDEMSARIAEHDALRLEEIQEALQMLDEGKYGRCIRCGKSITKRRLKAIPFATLCIHCKEAEERGRFGDAVLDNPHLPENAVDLFEVDEDEQSLANWLHDVEHNEIF